jgi:hypothetical protein
MGQVGDSGRLRESGIRGFETRGFGIQGFRSWESEASVESEVSGSRGRMWKVDQEASSVAHPPGFPDS